MSSKLKCIVKYNLTLARINKSSVKYIRNAKQRTLKYSAAFVKLIITIKQSQRILW